MEVVKINCGNCNRTWEVYWRDIKDDYANICPFCGEELDRDLWERDVVRAAAAALDCNMELERYATGYQKTLFRISLDT